MGLASQGNGDLSLNHEQHAFRTFIQFGAIAAATRLNFHDVLREGFGEAGEWARNHPEPRLVPEGQEACHDIAERAFGDHRIGFGEHGTIGEKLRLRRQSASRCIIGAIVLVVAHVGNSLCEKLALTASSGKPVVKLWNECARKLIFRAARISRALPAEYP